MLLIFKVSLCDAGYVGCPRRHIRPLSGDKPNRFNKSKRSTAYFIDKAQSHEHAWVSMIKFTLLVSIFILCVVAMYAIS